MFRRTDHFTNLAAVRYDVCVPPPRPRLLASPSAFVALELGPEQLLRVSKRDGKCFFDQLLLPRSLTPYMGRPSLTVGELLDAGFTEARRFQVDSGRAALCLQFHMSHEC